MADSPSSSSTSSWDADVNDLQSTPVIGANSSVRRPPISVTRPVPIPTPSSVSSSSAAGAVAVRRPPVKTVKTPASIAPVPTAATNSSSNTRKPRDEDEYSSSDVSDSSATTSSSDVDDSSEEEKKAPSSTATAATRGGGAGGSPNAASPSRRPPPPKPAPTSQPMRPRVAPPRVGALSNPPPAAATTTTTTTTASSSPSSSRPSSATNRSSPPPPVVRPRGPLPPMSGAAAHLPSLSSSDISTSAAFNAPALRPSQEPTFHAPAAAAAPMSPVESNGELSSPFSSSPPPAIAAKKAPMPFGVASSLSAVDNRITPSDLANAVATPLTSSVDTPGSTINRISGGSRISSSLQAFGARSPPSASSTPVSSSSIRQQPAIISSSLAAARTPTTVPPTPSLGGMSGSPTPVSSSSSPRVPGRMSPLPSKQERAAVDAAIMSFDVDAEGEGEDETDSTTSTTSTTSFDSSDDDDGKGKDVDADIGGSAPILTPRASASLSPPSLPAITTKKEPELKQISTAASATNEPLRSSSPPPPHLSTGFSFVIPDLSLQESALAPPSLSFPAPSTPPSQKATISLSALMGGGGGGGGDGNEPLTSTAPPEQMVQQW